MTPRRRQPALVASDFAAGGSCRIVGTNLAGGGAVEILANVGQEVARRVAGDVFKADSRWRAVVVFDGLEAVEAFLRTEAEAAQLAEPESGAP